MADDANGTRTGIPSTQFEHWLHELADLDTPGPGLMGPRLLRSSEAALERIAPLVRAGLPIAASIQRQLQFCRALARAEPQDPPPGPLSMGVIAARELEEVEPELAKLVYASEELANAILAKQVVQA